MAKFRQIMSEYWTDPQMIEEMTSEDKYFYLYLLTNPQTRQCGIYQISARQMALETGYSEDACKALIRRFEEHHKKIRYNWETRELAIKNWLKYNNINSPKTQTCIEREFTEVKDKSLIDYVKYPYDTPCKGYISENKTSGEEEKRREEEKEEKEKRNRFAPPTPQELTAYLLERHITAFTADKFIDYYQSRGWMIGKNKMKDWRAAVRTWQGNEKKPQKKSMYETLKPHRERALEG